jgi:hypothetical protein
MTDAISAAFEEAFRPYNVDGEPASGVHQVDEADCQALGATISGEIVNTVGPLQSGMTALQNGVTTLAAALISAGATVETTQAALFANLVPGAGALGFVWDDPTAANNGLYVKAGATTTGSWGFTGITLASVVSLSMLGSDVINFITAGGSLANASRIATLVTALASGATAVAAGQNSTATGSGNYGAAVGLDVGTDIAAGTPFDSIGADVSVPTGTTEVTLALISRLTSSGTVDDAPPQSGDITLATITLPPASFGLTPGAAAVQRIWAPLGQPQLAQAGTTYIVEVSATNSSSVLVPISVGVATTSGYAQHRRGFYSSSSAGGLGSDIPSTSTVTGLLGLRSLIDLAALTGALANFPTITNSNYAAVFVDDCFLISAAVNMDGSWIFAKTDPPAGLVSRAANWSYERFHLSVSGQSLSVGLVATPALSTSQLYNSTMLRSGVRTYTYSTSSNLTQWAGATLAPLVESVSTDPNYGSNNDGETGCSAACDTVNELILAENGLGYAQSGFQMSACAPGCSNQPIAFFAKGNSSSNQYADHLAVIEQFVALSQAQGVTFAVGAQAWIQGESDYVAGTSRSAYLAALQALQANWQADVQAATGQTLPVPFIVAQICDHQVYGFTNPTIALAQTDAAAANPAAFAIACPTYIFPTVTGANPHLTDVGQRWWGAYVGLVFKRLVIDGATWQPLTPKSKIVTPITAGGSAAVIEFNVPVAPLVLDTDLVAQLPDGSYGFQAFNSSGGALTVTSVQLVGSTRVKVTVSSGTIATVTYAWAPATASVDGTSGPVTGARGCLRDSAGDLLPIDPIISKPLHNHCLLFSI